MEKFQILPDSTGYSVTDGKEVISIQLDGGASRYRRDILNANSKVTCQWSFDRDEYQYMRAFYKTTTSNGSIPFLIDLILDESALTEHQAYFVPGSMALREQRGHLYLVSAELDVKPIPRDVLYDESLVMIWSNYYPDPLVFLNALEQLVNVDLPKAI
jgi:hypothetical protein